MSIKGTIVSPRLTGIAVVLALGVLGLAGAAEYHLAGAKLVLRQSPDAQHLVLVAREGVTAPLPGSTEDPTLVGGELQISNPSTREEAHFATSARDWNVNALGTVFRFRNHLETGTGSEVRAIVIKHKRQLKISTRAVGITLDEDAQQALSVVVRTGTLRYCLLFGGKIGKDKPGHFVAHDAPAPTACPTPIVVTTTSSTRPPRRPTTTTTTSPAASTTSTTHATTPTTSSTTGTGKSTTSTSTSSSSSTTKPPPITTSTSPPPSTTSTSTTVRTTTTTTSTAKPCSFRGNSCKGSCPPGLRCGSVLGACTCAL